MDQEERLQWIKWWTHNWERYERILYYYRALHWARSKEHEAEEYREKWNKLKTVQRTYCYAGGKQRQEEPD
jgi:hypothetical protein